MTALLTAPVYIDATRRNATGRDRYTAVNPATEEEIGHVPICRGEDVDAAVTAACAAAPAWAAMDARDRADMLRSLARALERRASDIARAITLENGMPIGVSTRLNGISPVRTLRYYADLIGFRDEELRQADGGERTLVTWTPIPVSGLIVPWNAPMTLTSSKLAPALAAGSTVVLKPALETSLHLELLIDALEEAGIPAGVVNIVTGDTTTGRELVAHPGVGKVAFTGSTRAGLEVARTCAEQFKAITLELGGKSAAIVAKDADLDQFADALFTVCSPYSGQVCWATTRILAPEAQCERIGADIVARFAEARVGDPFDREVRVGPLISKAQLDRVSAYVESAVSAGAEVLYGGGRPAGVSRGFFMEPTLIGNVDNQMTVAREEIFGPVVCLIPYKNEADAIRIANDSEYGLGGVVFSRDPDHAIEIARQIETGTVGINGYAVAAAAPFGGWKNSGIGVEHGPEALREFQRVKSIYLVGSR